MTRIELTFPGTSICLPGLVNLQQDIHEAPTAIANGPQFVISKADGPAEIGPRDVVRRIASRRTDRIPGAAHAVRGRRYSLAELSDSASDVSADVDWFKTQGARLYAADVDESENAVRVRYLASGREVETSILERYLMRIGFCPNGGSRGRCPGTDPPAAS